jgi:hypothetical protein
MVRAWISPGRPGPLPMQPASKAPAEKLENDLMFKKKIELQACTSTRSVWCRYAMHMFMHSIICPCMGTGMHTRSNPCVHAHTHAHARTRRHVCRLNCAPYRCLHAHTHVHTHMRAGAHTHKHAPPLAPGSRGFLISCLMGEAWNGVVGPSAVADRHLR